MLRNIGNTDRLVRFSAAAIVSILYFTGVLSGTTALVLGAVALMMALTATVRFCPLYRLVGVSTCPR